MTTEPASIAPLALKLSRILASVKPVSKDGRNEFHKYDYVTESSLVDMIRPELAKESIFMFYSVIDQRTDGEITSVTVECTFADGETGACFSVQGQGQGHDKLDKGVYKAITGAMKYVLMKNFLLSTDDDPEQERGSNGHTNHKAPERTSQPRQSAPKDRPPVASGPWQSAPIGFGKFKGKTLGDVAKDDISYMQWLQDKWAPKPKDDGSIWPSDVALQAAIAASKAPAGDSRGEKFVGEMTEVFEDDGMPF